MFLYANKDFYLKDKYLEQTVLAEREAAGAPFGLHLIFLPWARIP